MSSKKQSVMMDHTLQELSIRNSRNKSQMKRPYVLALLTSHLIGMEPGLLYLQSIVNKQWMTRVSAEESLFLHYTNEELITLIRNDDWIPQHQLSNQILNRVDILFIPILSFSLVSDIISLNEQRPIVRFILNSLFTGKTVVALKFGIDPYHPLWVQNGMDKGSHQLKRKLYNQLLELKAMGIKLIDTDETLDIYTNAIGKKSIVSAETIRYLHQQNRYQLNVTKESIITPLAKDVARELNITIISD